MCVLCVYCLGNVAGWERPAWVCGSGGALDLSSAYYIVRFIGGTSERGGCPVCVAARCFVSFVVGMFGRAGLVGFGCCSLYILLLRSLVCFYYHRRIIDSFTLILCS
jgi:hypothetical protein